MRKLVLLVAACIAAAMALPAVSGANGRPIDGQYIVVLKDGTDVSDIASDHGRGKGADVLMTYGSALKGYAAKLSPRALEEIEADPRVDYVQQDVEGTAVSAQTLPPGINRIDAELASPTALATSDTGLRQTPGDVAVFDTGIQSNHPDLNVAGGVNCLGSYTGHDKTINDQNGHGTHVAGTIGAKDDANGVVGVAPGVRLWSVRVLNNIGSGSSSTQLCGINWINANAAALGIKVVNSSQVLFAYPDDGNCGYTRNDALHKAICASTQAGIMWVFGAGNSGGSWANAAGPSYREVLTVTAMGDNNGTPNVPSTRTFTCRTPGSRKDLASQTDDKYASFSSYGVTEIDKSHTIAAPGACIYSTWLSSGYGYQSGTSMAAPHMSGAAHRCIVSGQCAGTVAETIQKLRADAQAWNDANPNWGFTGDPRRPVTGRYYGYLVNAGLY
jgi:subtilisin family serine protease